MGQGVHHTNAMIIDLTAGRACAIGTDTPLEFSSFGRAALSSAFKVICLDQTLACCQSCCYVATIMHGGTEPLTWRQSSAPPFAISWNHEKWATVNGIVYFMPDACSDSGSGRIAAFDLNVYVIVTTTMSSYAS